MERIADITIGTTIGTSEFRTGNIVMDQGDDRIVVRRENIEEFGAAIGRCGVSGEPAPERVYKGTDSDVVIKTIGNIDSRIARYELAQRITGPEDFYADKIDGLRRERRAVINDFNMGR